jgi:hypothetical protein
MNETESQSAPDASNSSSHKGWIAIGCATVTLAVLIVLLSDSCSSYFWLEDLPFVAYISAIVLIFLLPVYLVYYAIVVGVLRRTTFSMAARRRWLLGLPVLLLIGAILYSANHARPTVAIRWVLQGKKYKSIHSVHSADFSTMFSARRLAWFKIDPDELRSLIAQHQLTITNGVSFPSLLSGDRMLGPTGIADRIPLFRDSVCYARLGSDEFQHPFSVYVLTNPSHNEAVWYTTYDR